MESAMRTRRPLKPEDLFDIKFVDAVTLSPDGSQAVYQVRTIDVENDKYQSHLWLAPHHLRRAPKRRSGVQSRRALARVRLRSQGQEGADLSPALGRRGGGAADGPRRLDRGARVLSGRLEDGLRLHPQ